MTISGVCVFYFFVILFSHPHSSEEKTIVEDAFEHKNVGRVWKYIREEYILREYRW